MSQHERQGQGAEQGEELRGQLHRLVDALSAEELPTELDRLASRVGGTGLADASATRDALEALYGQPIPEAELARAGASLDATARRPS